MELFSVKVEAMVTGSEDDEASMVELRLSDAFRQALNEVCPGSQVVSLSLEVRDLD